MVGSGSPSKMGGGWFQDMVWEVAEVEDGSTANVRSGSMADVEAFQLVNVAVLWLKWEEDVHQ